MTTWVLIVASWLAGAKGSYQQNTTRLGAASDIVLSPPLREQVGRIAPRLGSVKRRRIGSANSPAQNQAQNQAPNYKPRGLYMRIVQLAGAVILLALVFSGADQASAQGSEAARQACTPDAMRLCSDVIPDVAKVTACMKAKSSQVSDACRVAMRGGRYRGHYHGHYHHRHRH
jgi:hypothetical protein